MEGDPVAPLNPPAAYLGGKRLLAARIVARIETIPHQIYAEPFVGMGGVFFRRRRRPRVEVVNDYSRDVATFFRVLQRHPDALLAELRFSLAARAEFDRLRALDPEALTDIERAARFFYLQRLAYAGKVTGRTYGVTIDGRSKAFAAGLAYLRRIHDRLAGVLIECRDFAAFLDTYDSAETLFYLDPPYWGGEGDYGKGLFARADFQRLADTLAGIKGAFLLSINDVPEVREIFAGFHLEEVETLYTVGAADRSAARAELIVSNVDPAGRLGPLFGGPGGGD